MENVPQIQPYQGVVTWNQQPERERRIRKFKKPSGRRNVNRLFTLSRIADDTHQTLVSNNIPIRLCVYQDKEDLLMDVVALDNETNENHYFSRSITDENLPKLVKQIHTQRGLVFDFLL